MTLCAHSTALVFTFELVRPSRVNGGSKALARVGFRHDWQRFNLRVCSKPFSQLDSTAQDRNCSSLPDTCREIQEAIRNFLVSEHDIYSTSWGRIHEVPTNQGGFGILRMTGSSTTHCIPISLLVVVRIQPTYFQVHDRLNGFFAG